MYKTNEEYILRRINGFYFLMSSGKCVNRKWVYRLNETGARIWQMCNTCSCFQELVACLEKCYNREIVETEKKEIYAYIHQLEKENLIIKENNSDRRIAESNK